MLQTLAVIGKEFPFRLIREVSAKAEDELQMLLSDLQMAEFIYEQPAVADVAYVFKHALSQQVAYGPTLVERPNLSTNELRASSRHYFPKSSTLSRS